MDQDKKNLTYKFVPDGPKADAKIAIVEDSNGKWGQVPWVVSRKVWDRDGEVVNPLGITITEAFRGNPLMLWAHNLALSPGPFPMLVNSFQPPIGRVAVETWEANETEASVDLMFDLSSGDSLAEMLFRKAQNRVLNAVSIGFDPSTVKRSEIEWQGRRGTSLDYLELWEVSPVPIPSNWAALQRRDADYSTVLKAALKSWDILEHKAELGFEKVAEKEPVKAEDLLGAALDSFLLWESSTKEGRVLSRRNLQRLEEAVRTLQAILTAAKPEDKDKDTDKTEIVTAGTVEVWDTKRLREEMSSLTGLEL